MAEWEQTAQISLILVKQLYIMAIFWFFHDGAVRHLEFLRHILGPITKSTWRSLSSGKIWLESVQ